MWAFAFHSLSYQHSSPARGPTDFLISLPPRQVLVIHSSQPSLLCQSSHNIISFLNIHSCDKKTFFEHLHHSTWSQCANSAELNGGLKKINKLNFAVWRCPHNYFTKTLSSKWRKVFCPRVRARACQWLGARARSTPIPPGRKSPWE